MTLGVACPPVIQQFSFNNGQLAAGGSILTQVGGINAATYQDSALTTPLPNPIPLNSRGEVSNASGASCQLFLTPNTVYTFTLSDANGNQIWVAAYVNGVQITTLPNTAITYAQTALELSAGITPTNLYYPAGNVLRYGADPTGAADSTYAFQQACFSAFSGWAPTAGKLYEVTIPSGRYLFSGVNTPYLTPSIFVRAGMALIGSGIGGTFLDFSPWGAVATHAMYMGWGFISGVATQDAGGQPPELAECFILGGPSGGGATVNARFNGGVIHDVWFSACGLAVYQSGFNVYNCVFDIGLQAIVKGSGTEEYISGCTFFNQAGGQIVFDTAATTDCSELIISECQFNYTQATSIILGSGGTANFQNIRVNDCSFILNTQYGGFSGFVNIAATNIAQFEFNDCSFRNMNGYAVFVGSANTVIDFRECVFDGKKTNASYIQSTTAGGINLSNGVIRANECQFRNLSNNGILIAGSGTQLTVRVNGLQYATMTASTFFGITNVNTNSLLFCKDVDGDGSCALFPNQSAVQVKAKNLHNWWGAQFSSGAFNFILLPYQHSSVYQITLSANLNAGGSGSYSKSASLFASKMNDFNGAATSFITTANAIVDPSETGSGGNAAVAISVLFGGVPGTGTATIASSNSGSLTVSWPNTYSSISLDIQPVGGGVA